MPITYTAQDKIAAKEAGTQNNVVQYPANLNSQDVPHITVIDIISFKKRNITAIEIEKNQGRILLPLAENIKYTDMQEWEEFDQKSIGGLVDAIHTKDDYVAAIGRIFGEAGLAFAEKAGAGSIEASVKIAESESGISFNPKRANVYRSPKFREFQLEYTFVAKSKKETDQIKNIERILRYYSSPEHTGSSGAFLKSPSLFQISHWSSDQKSIPSVYSPNEYLPVYLPAALVAFNVDYNSNGTNYMHKDTFAPIDIKITMAFKEVEYDTKLSMQDRFGFTEASLWGNK